MKALAVIGYHHTGKTTTVVALISALSSRGYKVASIKDIHSEAFRADTAGKNSALHIDAGSILTFARGLQDTAAIFPTRLDLRDMIAHIDADFLIIEGMKDAPVPKIVCAETEDQLDELIDETAIGISGMIADKLTAYKNLPVFCLQNRMDDLIQLVLTKVFDVLPTPDPVCCSRCDSNCYQMAQDIVQGRKSRTECVLDGKASITLQIDGKQLNIVPFVQDILRDTILALVQNLKDVNPVGNIDITIKR